MTTTAIRDVFDTRATRARASLILDLLHEHPYEDTSGRATRDFLPVLIKHGGRRLSLPSLNVMLVKMERAGFIEREVRGKRTFRIAPGPVVPDDYQPPLPADVDEELARLLAEEAAIEQRAAQPRGAYVPLAPPPDERDEAAVLGMRPGRLAARIERQVPGLVKAATTEALNDWLAVVAGALGFERAAQDHDSELERELDHVRLTLAQVSDELRNERVMGDAARHELNSVLAKTEKLTGHSLRPSDLPKVWRELATDAIKAGFVIRATNGGHYAWLAPGGKRYHSGNTPSDWRAVRNTRAGLERMGLPK